MKMTRKTNTAHGSVPDNAVWNVNSLQDECAGEKDLENLHQELPMDGVTGTSNIETQFDDKETAKILRKIDLRLLPVLTILYILSYLDRGNLGNAKVAGMNTDLSLTGTQYNIALTVRDFCSIHMVLFTCSWLLLTSQLSYFFFHTLFSKFLVMWP